MASLWPVRSLSNEPALRKPGPVGPACLLAAALVAAVLAPTVDAERTRFWRQSNFDEFEKGTPKGVALRSDGKLVLAPRFAQFSDPNAAYLWVLRVDSKGTLYAAGGSNAKVLRLDAPPAGATGDAAKATPVFDSQEMAAQALAIDAQDNLYIGTSPDGKVYKVTPGGQRSVFFEPKTKYIWDLEIDSDGTLYVATGDKGEVFAVARDGKGQAFYKSDDAHVRVLAFDAKGNLLLGTEPNGLVLRIEKPKPGAPPVAPEARQAFVIYETARKEVTSLVMDEAGNLYVAAVGEKARVIQPGQQMPTLIPQTTITPTGQTITTMVPAPQQTQFIPFPPTTGGSEVYRIGPEGAPEVLWTSRDDLVYALGFSPSGKLLLGTGNRGLVIQLEGGKVFSSLAKTASAQVTGLAQGPGRKVYLCTANPGKVFTLGPDYEPEGTFESQTYDAKVFSQWGRLSWWGENGSTDGRVAFYVRSGNTSNPEKNWSPWAGPYSNSKGDPVGSPAARFVQWKAVFKGPATPRDAEQTPSISWVAVAYLPKNVAPTIENIIVQNPGVRVQGFTQPQQQQQPAQLRLPPQTTPTGVSIPQPQPQQPQRFEPPPQGFSQRGTQSVVWSARDENDDDMVFSIYYRGEGEKNWKLLKEKVEQKFFSWDTSTMPDGAYHLKIVASDAPANPPEEALAAERESDRFEVDNSPPRVENLRTEAMSPDVRVRFEARDTYSAIARAEHSLDAGEWKLVFPSDRVFDAPQKTFDLMLKGLAPGEHTLAVRVYDQFENSSSAKVTFTIEAPPKR